MTKKNAAGSPEWTDPDDAPELTAEMLDRAEIFEGDTFVRRGRGRPRTGAAKELISVRLDADLVAHLRAAGPGWQSRINTLLRRALQQEGGAPGIADELVEQSKPASLENRRVAVVVAG
jgi:uncharacterized protein (DUF4415 family)